jgi:cell division protein ZapA
VAKTQDGIRVEIYDQQYNLRGDLDEDYIQQLAKLLDGKMRSIAARTHTVDSLRVAILAAMNIADEYQQLKTKYDNIAHQVDEKVGACNEKLDRLLKMAS